MGGRASSRSSAGNRQNGKDMKNRKQSSTLLLMALLRGVFGGTAVAQKKEPQPKEFTKWPAGSSPQEIGKRVAERYLAQDYMNLRRKPPSPTIIYPEVCTW